MPRKRRRKLPEAESKLLERIRHYEALLRDNNITFEPYHSDASAEQAAETGHGPPEDTTTQGGSPQPLTRRSDTFREEGTRYGYVLVFRFPVYHPGSPDTQRLPISS